MSGTGSRPSRALVDEGTVASVSTWSRTWPSAGSEEEHPRSPTAAAATVRRGQRPRPSERGRLTGPASRSESRPPAP